jgi:hypothetical protein
MSAFMMNHKILVRVAVTVIALLVAATLWLSQASVGSDPSIQFTSGNRVSSQDNNDKDCKRKKNKKKRKKCKKKKRRKCKPRRYGNKPRECRRDRGDDDDDD